MANEFPIKRLECETFDNRMLDRHIHQGRITPKDVADDLAALEDWSHNVTKFTVVLGEEDEPAQS